MGDMLTEDILRAYDLQERADLQVMVGDYATRLYLAEQRLLRVERELGDMRRKYWELRRKHE